MITLMPRDIIEFLKVAAARAGFSSLDEVQEAADVAKGTFYSVVRREDAPRQVPMTRQKIAAVLKFPSWEALLAEWRQFSGDDSLGTHAPADKPLRLTPATTAELAALRDEVVRLRIENQQLRAAREELRAGSMKLSGVSWMSPKASSVLREHGQELATAHDPERIAGILYAIAGEIMPQAPKLAAEGQGVKISSPKNKK